MAQNRILFADNDQDFLDTRAEFLKNSGYQVISAKNSAEARKALEQRDINIAILDIRLENDDDEKDNSGLILAKTSAYRSVPKIILTGFPSIEAAREAFRRDMNEVPPAMDFISKEEGPGALLGAVENAIKTARPSWKFYIPPLLLLGALGLGILGIIFGEPRWLIGTTVLGILFSLFIWQLVKG